MFINSVGRTYIAVYAIGNQIMSDCVAYWYIHCVKYCVYYGICIVHGILYCQLHFHILGQHMYSHVLYVLVDDLIG